MPVIWAVWLIVVGGSLPFSQAFAGPQVVAQAGVLMELQTGDVLWEKNKGMRLAPASTTKIMTALVVLERSRLDEIVTIPVEATTTEGTGTNLRAGERITVENLLYALLLRSGNDAAVALAMHAAGSVAQFAALMNEKARSIGATHSQFRNPNGLPEDGHLTTAEDLALIARAALRNAEFEKIAATRTHPWKSEKWQGTLANHNKLLGNYDGAIGVKTGYTIKAGQCLVAAARRGGSTFVAVILNSRGKAIWEDAKKLLDYGFKNFAAVELIDRGDTVLTSVVHGEPVPLAAAEPVYHLVARREPDLPQLQIALDEIGPPIAKGDKLGEAVFSDGQEEIARVDLVSTVAVSGITPSFDVSGSIGSIGWFGWLLVGLLVWRLRAQRRRGRYLFAGRKNRLRF